MMNYVKFSARQSSFQDQQRLGGSWLNGRRNGYAASEAWHWWYMYNVCRHTQNQGLYFNGSMGFSECHCNTIYNIQTSRMHTRIFFGKLRESLDFSNYNYNYVNTYFITYTICSLFSLQPFWNYFILLKSQNGSSLRASAASVVTVC